MCYYQLSVFQGIPGIIGPPGPAGQRGDKVGRLFLKAMGIFGWMLISKNSDCVQNVFDNN